MLRFNDIARRWLIIVDLRSRLGNGLDYGGIASHVLSDILNDGKGRHHAQFLFC
ncbi:hypothetical protein D3C80_2203890 [compost metagenome]